MSKLILKDIHISMGLLYIRNKIKEKEKKNIVKNINEKYIQNDFTNQSIIQCQLCHNIMSN